MSSENEGAPARKSWPRRILSLVVGLAVSLLIGAVVERVGDAEWLAEARSAQQEWIDAVGHTSPLAVGQTFVTELKGAFSGDFSEGAYSASDGKGKGLSAPFWALVMTLVRVWDASGLTVVVQVALGALAVAALNLWRTKGETMLFGNAAVSIFLGPIAVIAAASLLGFALWGLMMGALYALGWITGLAAAAAGATGIAGFCWLCLTKLGEKGAEHVITPKI